MIDPFVRAQSRFSEVFGGRARWDNCYFSPLRRKVVDSIIAELGELVSSMESQDLWTKSAYHAMVLAWKATALMWLICPGEGRAMEMFIEHATAGEEEDLPLPSRWLPDPRVVSRGRLWERYRWPRFLDHRISVERRRCPKHVKGLFNDR